MSEANRPIIETRQAYEAAAEAWAGRWQDKSFLAPRFDRFRAMLFSGARVLDLGCGPGLDAEQLAARSLEVMGLDLTRAMLEVAHGRAFVLRLVQGDSRRLPLSDRSFDGVWAAASLLHLPKREVGLALADVRRVLRRDGAFYSAMKVGDHDGMMAPSPGHPVRARRYFAHYRPDEWSQLLARAGFTIEEQSVENMEARPPDTPWLVTYARLPG